MVTLGQRENLETNRTEKCSHETKPALAIVTLAHQPFKTAIITPGFLLGR